MKVVIAVVARWVVFEFAMSCWAVTTALALWVVGWWIGAVH
jgi:hypothetical protein